MLRLIILLDRIFIIIIQKKVNNNYFYCFILTCFIDALDIYPSKQVSQISKRATRTYTEGFEAFSSRY